MVVKSSQSARPALFSVSKFSRAGHRSEKKSSTKGKPPYAQVTGSVCTRPRYSACIYPIHFLAYTLF